MKRKANNRKKLAAWIIELFDEDVELFFVDIFELAGRSWFSLMPRSFITI